MLVLSRKVGQKIKIATMGGDEVVITLLRMHGSNARIGIDAPSEMTVLREEIAPGRTAAAAACDELTPTAA